MADQNYVWMYGCTSKSVGMGLCWWPALSDTKCHCINSMCGLWH